MRPEHVTNSVNFWPDDTVEDLADSSQRSDFSSQLIRLETWNLKLETLS